MHLCSRLLPSRFLALAAAVLASLTLTSPLAAFCGFFVAKADTKLFNKASSVVIARKDDATVLTMVNDYRGEPKDFALVVPVPTFLEREQIRVVERKTIDHLDAYTAPRLVEYHDGNPCTGDAEPARVIVTGSYIPTEATRGAKAQGVTIEASYSVGEYDILILSAKQSDGLIAWLNDSGYKIPTGAGEVVSSYLRQKMRFFVAKVNLGAQAQRGSQSLRPLQVNFESPKFMLPIRLGTVNADGPQEMFVFTLTARGRVEAANYRTVKLPTDLEIPVYVKKEFGAFYRAMFDHQTRLSRMKVMFQEYAWDMNWCDPCAADPLSTQELRELGVFWQDLKDDAAKGGAKNVFVTRLHVRYDGNSFPEDLVFQETGDRTNFQGRYILRHPWKGEIKCEWAESYRKSVRERQLKEARTLSELTGWKLEDIKRKAGLAAAARPIEDGLAARATADIPAERP